MIKILKWITSLAVIGVMVISGFGIYVFDSKGTDVAFQSSDGNWANNEVLFKGRDFESMVFYFELYKIRCNVEEVLLQRITEKPSILTASRWFDDYSTKKWEVPLAPPHPNLKDAYYYPNASMEHCYNGGSTKKELALAGKRADEYLSSF